MTTTNETAVKCSPGPWTCDLSHTSHFGCTAWEVGPLGVSVAVMGRGPSAAEQEANARLIAAAPELKDELTALVDFVLSRVVVLGGDERLADDAGQACRSALAAIARATGKDSAP